MQSSQSYQGADGVDRDALEQTGTHAVVRRTDTRHGETAIVRVETKEQDGPESELKIAGAFDASTVREINPAVDAVVAEHPHRVTVDLDSVSLMDSTGVSVLVSLWKRIKAQGGSVVVVGAHDQ